MAHNLPPNRAELLAWLGVADPGTSPDDYDLALTGALAEQAADCDVTVYSEPLHHAALRRAARILAGKGMSLGVFDQGDFGTSYLPRFDALIDAAEMDHRLGGFA